MKSLFYRTVGFGLLPLPFLGLVILVLSLGCNFRAATSEVEANSEVCCNQRETGELVTALDSATSAPQAVTSAPQAAASAPAAAVPPADLPQVEPLKHENYTETVPGSSIKIEMIAIPGGTYLMGSPDNETGRNADEGPQHPVTIYPMWVSKTELTWDQLDPWWKNNPGSKLEQMEAERKKVNQKELDALSRPTPPYADETFGYGRDQMAAISVTHHTAMEYIHWLATKTNKIYRLPTEAEWEWACRAGTKTPYSFDPSEKLEEYAWFGRNSKEAPHPVGTKKANRWGLHDMHGNVAEWCLDRYRTDCYATFPLNRLTLEPVQWSTDDPADRFSHVVRGGSWADKAERLRSAARRGSDKKWNRQDPQIPKSLWWLTDADFVGFRLIRLVKEPNDNLRGIRSKMRWSSREGTAPK
jgi:formylglycine-generating enzyme required for sulfatase activity